MYCSPGRKIMFIFLVTIFFFTMGCKDKVGARNKAPDFSIKDLSGKTVSLSDYRGRVVVLDFWATWCPPCRMSIEELVKLQAEKREEGLVILGISMDHPKRMNDQGLRSFMKDRNINYSVLRYTREIVKDYFGEKEFGIPALFIIDRDGKIVEQYQGFNPGVLEKSLEKIL